jgi:type II secretory pathway pseudopilin PulG
MSAFQNSGFRGVKAAEDCRTPRRSRESLGCNTTARSWSAAVLCRFGIGHIVKRSTKKSPPLKNATATAFTLIELILVMSILVIAVSITAPALSNFFRGRTLDSEARRLLALTREGQSRAVSEGVPIELWFDTKQGIYGIEAEPSFEPQDRKAESFTLDNDMQIEVANFNPGKAAGNGMNNSMDDSPSSSPTTTIKSNHPDLPRIRFLPDGSVSETSPQTIRLIGRDQTSFWLALSRSRLNYEIRSQPN